ncbi:MAG: aldehyde dehydrogenase family protein [Planctomycetales bacterium]
MDIAFNARISLPEPDLIGRNGPVQRDAGSPGVTASEVLLLLRQARVAQAVWQTLPVAQRLQVVRRFRQRLAEQGAEVAATLVLPVARDPAMTLAAEIIPLADACRFLERRAARLLRPQRGRRADRPLWLKGVDVTLFREPHGVVLVLGTWNYPLFLPGVQVVQALVAGNAVLLKPGQGAGSAAVGLQSLLIEAGLDPQLLQVLPDDEPSGRLAVAAGVDHVLLTGSAATGRRVLSSAAETLTPCTLELSGCDAVFVQSHADLQRAAECVAFGLTLNAGATCIAPRRVFVNSAVANDFERRLTRILADRPPLQVEPGAATAAALLFGEALASGAKGLWGRLAGSGPVESSPCWPLVASDARPEMRLLQADLFAPVSAIVKVTDDDEALRLNAQCPYALGAVVFGKEPQASHLAARIDAGCVVINDLIVPTADPRVPFGGRRASGYGVTRGAAGLLNLTRLKAVIRRNGRWLPHLQPARAELLQGWLQAAHAGRWRCRLAGVWQFLKEAWKRRQNPE